MARTSWWQYLSSLPYRGVRKPIATLFLEAIGLFGDTLDELAKAAVKASFPGLAPIDAQDEIGEEIGFERSPLDTQATYGETLRTAHAGWFIAGTRDSLQTEIRRHGYTGAVVLESLTGYPVDEWAGFVVVLPYDHGTWADGAWDDPGTWTDGGVWDCSRSIEWGARLSRVIEEFKPRETRLRFALAQVTQDAELWDWPAGAWDDPGDWATDDTGFVQVAEGQ